MRKLLPICSLLIISLFISVQHASACSSPYATGYGARATGMGGAFAAIADDPSAVFFNPAGLAQLRGNHITLGHSLIEPNLWYKDSGGSRADDPIKSMMNPLVFLASDLGTDSFTFGLGASLPYGYIAELHKKEKAESRLLWYNQEWQRFIIYLGSAYQFTPEFSLGIGCGIDVRVDVADLGILSMDYMATNVVIDILDAELESFKIEEVIIHHIEVPTFDAYIKVPGVHPHLGLLYKPMEKLDLALAYRGQTKDSAGAGAYTTIWLDIEAKTNMGDFYFKDLEVSASGEATMFEYIFPQQGVFGLAFEPFERLTLAADLIWTDWSTIEKDYGRWVDDPDPAKGTKYMSNLVRWEDTYVPRFGLEFRPFSWLALRGGYYHEPSPIPDSANANRYVDFGRDVYSAGLGLSLFHHRLELDFYYQYSVLEDRYVDIPYYHEFYVYKDAEGKWDPREYTDPDGTKHFLYGEWNTKAKQFRAGGEMHNFGASLIYRF